jgi:signal transduction histidine kinase
VTLWRRVTPVILRVSLLTALVGTLATFTITGWYVLGRTTEHLQVLVRHVGTESFSARCQAEPSGHRTVLENGDQLTTYDLARLPAPPLGPDASLLRSILAGDPTAHRILFLQAYGGVMLMRLAPAGACSLVELRWKLPVSARLHTLGVAIALACLSAALTALLSALRVVRPLISRVQRLNAAASRIGQGPGYASAADPISDELGTLSSVLDGADERIWSATQQLVDRNQQLQRHLADIAHDLKTPLTAVQLTLEQAVRAAVSAETRELVARGLDDCIYLAAMIDNLRVGTQLRDGLEPSAGRARAELGELVAQVVRRLERLGRYKGVELNMARPEDEVWCACRPLVLERVVDNLVYNAVSHGRAGDHVAVLLETEGEHFRLTVLDDGPGMPPEELAALRRRYFRGTEAELHAARGTGLGLSIVAEVCRRCGWELRFESNEPSGLRVTVSGPMAEAPLLGAPSPRVSAA